MGGVLIIISIVIPTLLWADLRFPYVWVALLALVGYGLIGFIDDYNKLMKRQNLGITGRHKMLLQVGLALRDRGHPAGDADATRLYAEYQRAVL